MPKYNEGPKFEYFSDMRARGVKNPSARPDELNPAAQKATRAFAMKMGQVAFPVPEPINKQTNVSVNLVDNGLLTSVAWPGAQVDANVAGLNGGFALGIHGLYESPLVGQQVLVGFVEGNVGDPVVVQKYPYLASQRIDLEFAHFLPLTTKAVGPTDVVLGHHTGSFIALRGTLPLPSQIDIFSFSNITMTSVISTTFTSLAHTFTDSNFSVTSAVSASISSLLSINMSVLTNSVSISPAGVTITAGASTFAITPSAITLTVGTTVLTVSAVGVTSLTVVGLTTVNTHIHPTGVGPSGPPLPGT